MKADQKICNIHVQNEGGVKDRLNNVKKTALFSNIGFPYSPKVVQTIFVYMFGVKKTLEDYFIFLFDEPNNICSKLVVFGQISGPN